MLVSINPATGEDIARFAIDAPDVVDRTLSSAAMAQAAWREVPVERRVELLRRLAVVLRRNAAGYARLIVQEMGKPIAEALGEIEKCAWTCEVYADRAPVQLADQPVASGAARSVVAYEPLGVLLAIMPWNYPFWQVIRAAAPALAAGNGLILKHAANVTGCALALRDLFAEAEAPAGLFGVLLVETAQVEGVIADDRIAAVTLTGSTEVGAIVAGQAGRALKKQVLELGGSDPFLVLADADVEAAAATAVKARFINAGQSCVNAKRFIVVEDVADAFVEAFVRRIGALRTGHPLAAATDLGPLARGNLRDQLHRQVEATLAAGGSLRLGGHIPNGAGFFYPPTLIDHVRPGMAAFDEETFGPVAAVIRVADEDEAVRLANQTSYGLAATVWSRDVARAERVARRIEAGAVFVNGLVASDPRLPFGGIKRSGYGLAATVWSRDVARAERVARRIEAGAVFVNGLVASDPRLPFGGIKRSGYGRELGEWGIREFVNVKTLWFGTAPETTDA